MICGSGMRPRGSSVGVTGAAITGVFGDRASELTMRFVAVYGIQAVLNMCA